MSVKVDKKLACMHVQLQGMGMLKNAKMYKKGERNNTYLTKNV